MNTLFTYLKKNPALLSKYVSIGFAIVDKTVSPLNRFMKHLLVIQGIDPKTQPGDVHRAALQEAVDTVVADDNQEYYSDFDFSVLNKRFESTRERLNHLNLDKEQFKKLTDLTFVNDRSHDPLQIAKRVNSVFTDSGELKTDSLKGALKTLKKYAEELELDEKKETFAASRQSVAVGRNRKQKAKPKVVKTFKKGVFRRINDDI